MEETERSKETEKLTHKNVQGAQHEIQFETSKEPEIGSEHEVETKIGTATVQQGREGGQQEIQVDNEQEIAQEIHEDFQQEIREEIRTHNEQAVLTELETETHPETQTECLAKSENVKRVKRNDVAKVSRTPPMPYLSPETSPQKPSGAKREPELPSTRQILTRSRARHLSDVSLAEKEEKSFLISSMRAEKGSEGEDSFDVSSVIEEDTPRRKSLRSFSKSSPKMPTLKRNYDSHSLLALISVTVLTHFFTL